MGMFFCENKAIIIFGILTINFVKYLRKIANYDGYIKSAASLAYLARGHRASLGFSTQE